jgi:DNA-directed RNA polymerase alpha subunit
MPKQNSNKDLSKKDLLENVFFKDLKKINDNHIQFIISCDNAMCNSLRRIMISEVPILAVDKVIIHKNNGILQDELLSHRIGLIPISHKNPGKNSSSDSFKINLDVSFDKEKADQYSYLHTIYSHDLIPEDLDLKVQRDIIITKLKEGQSIKLEAYAYYDIGKTHAKWSPSCGISYKDNDDGTFLFNVETNECISAKDVFVRSLEILQNKLNQFKILV